MLKTAASTEGQPTIFDKILDKSIPSTTVHDDDLCYAFADINPQGPFHCLVIPKERDGLTRLSNAREDQKAVLGHLMYTAGQIGKANCPEVREEINVSELRSLLVPSIVLSPRFAPPLTHNSNSAGLPHRR